MDDAPAPRTAELLETKIGFLERTVESLNEVVLDQACEIERLAGRLALLEARLATGGSEGGDEAPDPLSERPPHY
jgi:SlyX protein